MSGQLVRDIMSPGVLDCGPDCPIQEVARRMAELDVSALVVTDDLGYLAGIVSRTDLVRARALAESLNAWTHLTAEQIMSTEVVTVTSDTPLGEASQMLAARKIHRLVVVEGPGPKSKPIGVLSITDIVREMAEE
ncbi:MAG: hypothetical protein A2Z04_08185 [Chloroflexi bacterium RBG_16_57_9]|nr:MAG: hypothetical protein A2Z04_08185 [Chloroflexi bacterium RBG_16_57_9]